MPVAANITTMRYPSYVSQSDSWMKWRLTYAGGDPFIRQYLQKYSQRESSEDFKKRQLMTYLPAFAKAAVNEIKNSIFQRMQRIRRLNGSDSYQQAIQGREGGVDKESTSMNTFIGQTVMPELLSMACVGVYVDMPPVVGETYAERGIAKPYMYIYRVEDILNCTYTNINNAREFQSVVLRDRKYATDPTTGLPTGEVQTMCRHLWIAKDGYVRAQFYEDGTGDKKDEEITLNLRKIPFITGDLSDSLLAEVANYQIALMNICSSDLAYVLLSNFPFYTEQQDGINVPNHLSNEEGSDKEPNTVNVGHTVGRTYKIGADRPGFIHPSGEPMQVSMNKQEQMKSEIRQLVQLAVANLQPKMASAESKSFDVRNLEAGLSCIGLELERMERKIAEAYAAYEGGTPAEIKYPEKYMLKTDEEKWNEAEKLSKRLADAPSIQYKREITKKIARIMLEDEISSEKMAEIESQIDKATAFVNDPVMLQTMLQNGVISTESAGNSQALPADESAKAAKEHAARIQRIAESQAKGNGLVNGAPTDTKMGSPEPKVNQGA